MPLPTLEHLLEKEMLWERQEEAGDLVRWWMDGIQLYKNLLRHDDQNERYRVQLANLLLKAGGDLKMRQHNFREATRLFRQLVRQIPDHAIAYYRLGFLAFYEQDWRRSITYFSSALSAKPSNRTHELNEEQRAKAYGYQAKAYQKISLALFEEAKRVGLGTKDPATADAIDSFLLQTERELFSYEEVKPYVMATRNQVLHLNKDEVIEKQAERGPSDIRLDLLGEKFLLVLPSDDRIELTEQLARLLRYLMEQGKPVTSQMIREAVFPDSKSESIVRRTISRLRETIRQSCRMDELICTTPTGYSFHWPADFQIFYRKDDLFLTDILDN
ncbi:winged helix-turn-helix domain-containing protein [Brevibacillus centrosporus]|uniref:winged helix-turn-helix domain-containing protein n=1 Tax=Brevibacillus centrosporus TaxID=54910 RepID=UPI003D21D9BD